MKIYSYIIPRDFGFAPNPYFGYCTLATCKPGIRKGAHVGDWIAAYGSAKSDVRGKLVMLMQVCESMCFDDYWSDARFKNKIPVFNKGIMHMYGDNIYHHVEEQWFQEPSHHSNLDGSINKKNLYRDTGVDRVLIATEFYYFGNNAIEVPTQFEELSIKGRNYKISNNENLINEFVKYIRDRYYSGIYGTPYSRKTGEFAHYKGE